LNIPPDSILPVLLLLLIKGTLILLATWCTCRLLRRSSASLRHALWTSTFCAILLMPLMSVSLPDWNINWKQPVIAQTQMPVPQKSAEISNYEVSTSIAGLIQHPSPPKVERVVLPEAGQTNNVKVDLPYIWFDICMAAGAAVWLFGFLIVTLQFLIGLVRIERIRRFAIPLAGSDLTEAHSSEQVIGVRDVTFLTASKGSGIAVPVTWGLVRPIVLLPEQWESWSQDCLRAALLHELSHVRRLDWLTQLVGRLACSIYWFHPLVWKAARFAREESERACDDAVLDTGIHATDYAQKLVDVVRSMPKGPATRTVAITMALPTDVESRVKSVLAPGLNRTPRTPRVTVTALLALIGVTAGLTAIHLIPSAQATDAKFGLSIAPGQRAYLSTITPGPKIVATGNEAVLPNGFKITLVGLTQATQVGKEWNMRGDVWWAPGGTPIMPEYEWEPGHINWEAPITCGLAPYTFELSITPPSMAMVHPKPPIPSNYSLYDYTFYDQFDAALTPGIFRGASVIYRQGAHGRIYLRPYTVVDDSAPEYFQGIGGTGASELYAAGTHTCVIRCGIAQGPWHTIASYAVPSVSFSTSKHSDGTQCKVYFSSSVATLPNVARRYVVVSDTGEVVPLDDSVSPGSTKFLVTVGGVPSKTLWLPVSNIGRVKTVCLQTRTFQTVEFRDVQLQPDLGGKTQQAVGDAMEEQDTTNQITNAQQLRIHLLPWAQANKALLQQMHSARSNDFTAIVEIGNSLHRLPRPLWSEDPRQFGVNNWPILLDEVPSGMTVQHLQRTHDSIETQMRSDFAMNRDFAIAQSLSGGQPNITLWASGRITRAIHGTPSSQQELAPGYFSISSS